jgi:hypothetical protein
MHALDPIELPNASHVSRATYSMGATNIACAGGRRF